ncbi:MAG: NUDIX domain-containing protein [Methanomassiliicoccales archaeon]|jgi:8-oxo-dGTP diphosphatase|nr:NUDIX domain-containing protein [Methanomassiliicoccales archaeon]
MSVVVAVAVENSKFLMVYNPKRKGWEFPGGRVEEDEEEEEACVREFVEEVGFEFIPRCKIRTELYSIFVGKIGKRVADAEMSWRFFDSLPDELSFPAEEYAEVLKKVRSLSESCSM